MTSKTRILALTAVLVLVAGISAFGYFHIVSLNDDEYMSVAEFYQSPEYIEYLESGEFELGARFDIEDVVLNSTSVRFPTLVYHSNPANVDYDLLNATVLTFAYFESLPDSVVGFLGNRTNGFPPMQNVRFSIETETYFAPWHFGTESPDGILAEPVSVSSLVSVYHTQLASRYYAIVRLASELVDNSSQLLVSIEFAGDYYPMPFTWANVTVTVCSDSLLNESHVQPRVELRDGDGSFLGVLDSSRPNSSISARIKPTQHLVIPYESVLSGSYLLLCAIGDEGSKIPWGHVLIP